MEGSFSSQTRHLSTHRCSGLSVRQDLYTSTVCCRCTVGRFSVWWLNEGGETHREVTDQWQIRLKEPDSHRPLERLAWFVRAVRNSVVTKYLVPRSGQLSSAQPPRRRNCHCSGSSTSSVACHRPSCAAGDLTANGEVEKLCELAMFERNLVTFPLKCPWDDSGFEELSPSPLLR